MQKVTIFPDNLQIIKQIPLFFKLSASEQKFVAERTELITYQKDEFIYEENQAPDAFYCLVTGRVKAFTKDASGKEVVVEYLCRGTYFGVISLLTGNNHSVTTQAVSDSLALRILKSDFDVILKSMPHLAVDLSQNLLRRVKQKEIHEKRIFESSIISVFNINEDGLDGQIYSINLATSLKQESRKNVLLVDLFLGQSKIKQVFRIRQGFPCFEMADVFADGQDMKNHILALGDGVDFINIKIQDSFNVKAMIALLGFLVNDYHFVVINVDFRSSLIYDFLPQTDIIHLTAGSNIQELQKAGSFLNKLSAKNSHIQEKVKVILLESGSAEDIPVRQRDKFFAHKVFATLKISREIYFDEQPLVINMPELGYVKAVRRIARETAGLRIGLVLGSGAALGLTQIGVIKVLEAEQIPIDVICGSSIGAFFGGLWAIGKSSGEIEDIALNYKKFESIFNMTDFVFPLRGVVKGKRLLQFFKRIFEDKTFFDVKKALKVVACDVVTMQEAVIEKGDIANAIMASVSIPALFEPIQIGNRYFIDGGVLNPLPCDVLLRMGINKIIAVNVLPGPEDIGQRSQELNNRQIMPKVAKPNIFSIIVKTTQSMEYKIAKISGEMQADIVLHPDVSNIEWYEFYSAKDLIKRGEEEARKNIEKIRELSGIQ